MDARRKKEIRSLIHTIPQLIKSSLVNQAFETEKIIASTFEFSESFQGLMHNIPQNHIEKIADWYSKLSFKAFQGGINNAKTKLHTVKISDIKGEELDEEIKTKIPMPYTLSQHLTKSFQDQVGQQLQTVPNANDIFVQFKQDIEKSYREGVKEYLETLEPVEEVEVEEEVEEPFEEEEVEEAKMEPSEEEGEEESFLEEWLSEIADTPSDGPSRDDPIDKPIDDNTTTGGTKRMGGDKKKPKLRKDPILADVSDNEIIKALEEYTRLPGDSQAEMVLRYELGLPPTKAKAATEEVREEAEARIKARRKATAATAPIKRRSTVRGGKVVGPYDTQALRQKVLTAVKTHVIDNNDLQSVVIDSIVADINNMSEQEVAQAIAKKMEFSEALANNGTLEDVKARADALAQKLTTSIGLPGDVVFVDAGGDYLLTFAFHRSDAAKLGQESESTSLASRSAKSRPLPKGPQGVLSGFDRSQIEQLAALGKTKTMRDIRKASAKVAGYLSDILKNIRTGRVGLAEGTSKLRSSIADVVGEVFGMDGLGYYEYLTKSKKRA